uniref:Uncharacterized protein n=1 Tax=Arundo donax TaxID=35708 RepID=A0A0A9BH12_ARUDO
MIITSEAHMATRHQPNTVFPLEKTSSRTKADPVNISNTFFSRPQKYSANQQDNINMFKLSKIHTKKPVFSGY